MLYSLNIFFLKEFFILLKNRIFKKVCFAPALEQSNVNVRMTSGSSQNAGSNSAGQAGGLRLCTFNELSGDAVGPRPT